MAKNPYINAYHNDTLISQGDGSAPLNVGPLNASTEEQSAAIPVKLQCEAGYKTVGNTVVSFEGTSNAKWTVCDTELGVYQSTLTLSSEINAVGTTIYVKAKATSDEAPSNDTSVDIKVSTTIAAV